MPVAPFEVVCEIEPATRPDLTRVRHQIGVLSTVATSFLIPDNHIGRATVSSIAVAHEVERMGGRSIACVKAATRRQRRAASKQLPALTAAMDAAAAQWTAVGEPEANSLGADIRHTERQLRRLSTQAVREQLDDLPARAPERAQGLDRGLGL